MRWRIGIVAVAVLAASAGLQTRVSAEDPLFVDWTSLAPSLSPGLDPDSDNLCKKGHDACVHSVIQEMTRRFNPLADDCDHDAIFALTYLRTTEEYHRFWHEGQFADPAWLNHYDAVFGDYYFRAFDDWHKGRTSAVPPAWRIAFEAADAKRVTGSGNLFLGMSAHINRDLPFVLYSIGLAAPDGTSRKADHDRVNEFLNRVSDAIFPELARRFDPTVDDSDVPGTTLDNLGSFQVVPAWREQAWRNAERLANAPTDADRARVAQEIETNAALDAQAFVAQTSYSPLSSFNAADRDAYCALHHAD
jgi:hypothetical protein